ncbi:MAG: acyltransferase, partial [Muribaculaceae bacterium]|nr:acyltransferase [Muribaculaceae bacterium]
ILPPALLFMVLYAVLPLAWGGTDAARATSDFFSIPLNFPELAGHLWFLYPLISIYLFTPMISPWLYQATKRQEQFFIALFAVSTLMPYLNHWFGYVWGECFWNQYHLLWYFSGYLGYVVAAHYIRVHLSWSRSKRVAVGLPMLLIGAAATIWSFYAQTTVQALIPTPEAELGWSFCTINVLVLTLGAFLLFSCIELKTTPAPVLQLSRLSYSMYLMHIFWLLLVVSIIKEDMNLASPVAIPLIAVVTFCLCWATARLLSFLPCSLWLGIEKPKK